MMYRRRPIGRRSRRPGAPATALLNQAHQALEMGEPLQAAAIYERLAQGAVRRGIPRAPFLFLQAGKAYLIGGEKVKGFTLVKHGLQILAAAGRWQELYRVGQRTLVELQEKGFQRERARLEAWLEETLPADFDRNSALKPASGHQHLALPTHCPQCGGVLDPQAVAWLDSATAECLYCGSPVRAED